MRSLEVLALFFSAVPLGSAFKAGHHGAVSRRSHSLRKAPSSALSATSVAERKPATASYEDAEKQEVSDYFNTVGFERWNKIYSETDDVNSVQKDIREGHHQTVDKVLAWMKADDPSSRQPLKGQSFCDAGCGVGSLALPLAAMGAAVDASDISQAMTEEAARRASEVLPREQRNKMKFVTSDLENLKGSYDNVACIDVMIHYPSDKMFEMVQGLGKLAKKRLIVSFAPDTWYYAILKKVGELFPGPSKTTRAYLHKAEDVEKALKAAGFTVKRREFTGTRFYFSQLFEAVRE
uniref:Magnesium-protoporphyrin IX methyltransferase C-terminal domain-containing protein n=1 Tax=Chromera velia CCMP2878 TaxID=1169474 RepID=A0A0G4HLL5_9ALVE|eukprot:Cvel_28860.t1-p1 / transcript=Cvel_28860.t1 / gene=Cvel_28860 / organism=Chromera_velia_CCMP2878 / gene_product=Magnesium protoporphyrin IX methyltransferase,, putative / transcript_product=Magnesium protoporphyrin IX methyltransferase,, putative / location=Cvel_scaffold3853:9388-11550(-) / protein_length=292 / sequence_SO=supercontig / SO=protein_coding / is_pseudo=false